MTLKMHQITDFPSFYEKIKNQEMPFKTSYHISLLAIEVQKHLDFYQENFQNLLMKYSKKDKNGNPIPTNDGRGVQLEKETMDEAYDKLNELCDLDVELSDTKFSPSEFEKIKLSPIEMNIILPFIEE